MVIICLFQILWKLASNLTSLLLASKFDKRNIYNYIVRYKIFQAKCQIHNKCVDYLKLDEVAQLGTESPIQNPCLCQRPGGRSWVSQLTTLCAKQLWLYCTGSVNNMPFAFHYQSGIWPPMSCLPSPGKDSLKGRRKEDILFLILNLFRREKKKKRFFSSCINKEKLKFIPFL